ncbi:MAG: MFS transporter [Thermomicrobiales bacterium]|nr:MFS transporter [Thermomicrobiales bacterium]
MARPQPESVNGDSTASTRARIAPRGLSAFNHRNYRLFFGGQLISVTGTWMQTLAQAWLVLSLTDSALQFSLVGVCQFGPVLLLSLAAGVIADRYPKRSVLLATQSAAALLAGTLALLVATDNVQLWHVYALALGLGIVNAIDMPTRQAFVSEMVGKEDLPNAIAMNSTVFNSGRIVGPALAGLLLASQGPALCFGLNAVSYIAVLIGLLKMRLGPSITARDGTGLQRMREGFAYVRASPAITMPISLITVVAIFGLNFNLWVPLLAKNEFDAGADGFGILFSAVGIGSLAGALFLAFSARGPRPRQILVSAAILGTSELLLAGAAAAGVHVASAFVILPVMGFSMSTTNAMANTIVQTASPAQMRGRVMSVYMTCFAGTAPIGTFLSGLIADRFGTPTSIAIGGGVTVAASIGIALYFHAWRADSPALDITGAGRQSGATLAIRSGSRD